MPEPKQETWLKLVALTVIVMVAGAAVSAFKSIGYATQVQMFAAQEARHWQDYQVVSLKKDNFAINRDILLSLRLSEGKAAKSPKTTAARIKEYDEEVVRLNQERDQIKKVAQGLAAREETLEKKSGELGLAVILFLLAILGAATGALTRKKILWLIGLGLGGWGLVYLVKGIFL
jgi:Domain of unknown function (DUF4337)